MPRTSTTFQVGHKKVGGRKSGGIDKRTRAAMTVAAKKACDLLGPDEFAGNALDLLQLIYRDEKQPMPMRLDAARVAVNFECPKLQAVAARVDQFIKVDELSDEERQAQAMRVIDEAFAEHGLQTPLSWYDRDKIPAERLLAEAAAAKAEQVAEPAEDAAAPDAAAPGM
jgi:hypothetical protein